MCGASLSLAVIFLFFDILVVFVVGLRAAESSGTSVRVSRSDLVLEFFVLNLMGLCYWMNTNSRRSLLAFVCFFLASACFPTVRIGSFRMVHVSFPMYSPFNTGRMR